MKKFYCVVNVVEENNMTLYKGEVKATEKPEDVFFGDRNFSIGIDFFTSKKERDDFYFCNDMSEEKTTRRFWNKTYHSVLSIVTGNGMILLKGKTRAARKPEDLFRGDRNLSLTIDYFDSKKERDLFVACNDMSDVAV